MMNNKQEQNIKRYQNMTIEEIITELYELGNAEREQLKRKASRWIYITLTSIIIAVVICFFQIFGTAHWLWWLVVALCIVVVIMGVIPTFILLFSYACAGKCVEMRFVPLIEQAFKLKYGEYTPHQINQVSNSQFMLNFIIRHNERFGLSKERHSDES